MAIDVPSDKPDAIEPDDFPVYGNHKFTANEIVAWRLVAEDADAFWDEHGSDNTLDTEFKQRFGVTFFEHAYLSGVSERWVAKGKPNRR